MPRLSREELIQNVKDCGQSLIDNAEKIVNGYEYLEGLVITCYVDEIDRAPYINVDIDFIPKKTIERLMERYG